MSLLAFEQLDWGDVPPSNLVIWLHGLGASGDDFVPIIPQLKLPKTAGIRFIFPHAKEMPVTLNGGYRMPAWYDIYDLNRQSREDASGILASVADIEALMTHFHAQGFALNKIVLAGFSQGGVIALMTGLKRLSEIAGILGLSTYLPRSMESVEALTRSSSKSCPIMIAHGVVDDVVPLAFAQERFTWMTRQGIAFEEHLYRMSHEVCNEEIRDIRQWLVSCLGLS